MPTFECSNCGINGSLSSLKPLEDLKAYAEPSQGHVLVGRCPVCGKAISRPKA